jgi:hypothetical protein
VVALVPGLSVRLSVAAAEVRPETDFTVNVGFAITTSFSEAESSFDPKSSVTVNIKSMLAVAVGVPEIKPVEASRVKPAGSVPLLRIQFV